MEADRNLSKSTNEDQDTGINSSKPLYNKMKPFKTSKDGIEGDGSQNCQIISNILQSELTESIQHNLLSFSKDCFCKLPVNEQAGLEVKTSNERPSIPNHFKQTKLNETLENSSSRSMISDSISMLNWTLIKGNRYSHLQLFQSNKENIVGVTSAFIPTSILANAEHSDGSCSYNNFVNNLCLNIRHENHGIHYNSSKKISLPLTTMHCLPLYNQGDSFINKHLYDFIKLEHSRKIAAKDVLSSQINVCIPPESKVSVGEMTEQLLKKQSYMSNELFKEQCCGQLPLDSQKMAVNTKGCVLQSSNLESGQKCSLSNSTESVLSSSITLLVNPEISIDIKEKLKHSVNQINSVSFQLPNKYNEQVITSIMGNDLLISSTMSLKGTMPTNLELDSKCSKVESYVLGQDNVSTRPNIYCDEGDLHKRLCEGSSSFKLQHLFNTRRNLSLIGTSSTMNLFNELRETLPKQFAENSQAFIKDKLLLSNTMISTHLKEQNSSSSSLSRVVEVNETTTSNPQNKINKLLIDSDNTQVLQNSQVTNNISKNYADATKSITDNILKHKVSTEFKTLISTLSNLKTNSFLQNVNLESFKADLCFDCTIQGCNLSLGNEMLVVQHPDPPGTVENTLQAKLLSNSNNNVNVQPIFKEVDTFKHKSLVQSKVDENILLCSPLKGRTIIDVNKKLASDQQLLTNSYVESNLNKQHKVQGYPTNDNITQLIKGESESNKNVSKKPLINSVKLSQENSNTNELSRKDAPACLNKTQSDIFANIELSEVLKFNKLFQTEYNIPSSTDELDNNTSPFNKIAMRKNIQFCGEPSDDEHFDADIDRAIDESINKYESFMCDKGVLATPVICDKSSQTDTKRVERQHSCKRCLTFDEKDLIPSKRTKTYHKNIKESNFLNCEQVDTSTPTKLIPYGVICALSSNLTRINTNGSNKHNNLNDDLTHLNLTINQDLKDNVNMDILYGENSDVNEEFSLYEEDMDVDDRLHLSKDSKEMFENESVLSDQKVPVVEEKVEGTVYKKSTSSFTNNPKKPILKVGLSRSARLKPLHQK